MARNSAALMSLSSGTNSLGLDIREMEVVFVMAAALPQVGLIGVFTALTDRRTQT
ncbi:hypothetical protein [Streptomyces sp. NPDC051364]|uniref:hypothetical protein n=1 Tax=Streptomyces sp. NPDC051364 TaxID=3155799 RepID=UPI00344AE918